MAAPSVAAFPTGTWQGSDKTVMLEFRPDGTWTFHWPTIISNGTYIADGTTLTITKDDYWGDKPGTYSWTHEDDRLTLTRLHDPHSGRSNAWDKVWHRAAG